MEQKVEMNSGLTLEKAADFAYEIACERIMFLQTFIQPKITEKVNELNEKIGHLNNQDMKEQVKSFIKAIMPKFNFSIGKSETIEEVRKHYCTRLTLVRWMLQFCSILQWIDPNVLWNMDETHLCETSKKSVCDQQRSC